MNLSLKSDSLSILLPVVFCLAISTVMFAEVYDITVNPAEYINRYGISPDENKWQYRSVENFRMQSLACAIIPLAFAGWHIYKRGSK